jgi:hypothetical protein
VPADDRPPDVLAAGSEPARHVRWPGWRMAIIAAVVVAVATAAGLAVARHGRPALAGRLATCRSAGAAASAGTIGIGSAVVSWETTHRNAFDPVGEPNSRWDPQPQLPPFEGHEGAAYTSVFFYCGLVWSYQLNLSAPTVLPVAKTLARSELPADATSLWWRRQAGCLQAEFSSAALTRALVDRFGRRLADARVLTQFDLAVEPGGLGYHPNRIKNIEFLIGGARSPAGSPPCTHPLPGP